ncbi:MAG: lipase secretion chaperone [Marinobacter sp.]|uniref:lipase secretion chaperone n=1 Tax=Marinobacter sp. TaxID=50741 RepID=UPI0034A03553
MSKSPYAFHRKSLIVLAGASIIAGVGVWFSSHHSISAPEFTASKSEPPQTEPAPALTDTSVSIQNPSTELREPIQPGSFRTPESLGETPFANSLAGTDIDGQLHTDAAGNLVVDLQTKDFFDYFLNTVGEVDPETALGKIESLARSSLPDPAADEAIALLAQYLNYKQKVVALGNHPLDPARQQDPVYQLSMFKQALYDLKQLRTASFDPDTHQAFFGLEEAYGEYTLASLDLQQRNDLSEEARGTLQAWHRQQLPEVIRQTETRLIEEEEVHSRRQSVLAKAASPKDAGEQLRKLGMAPDQADDVVSYLSERKQFESTYDQYQTELTQLQQAGLAPDDLATRQDELLKTHFEDGQTRTWARLKSLEQPSQ